MVAEVAIAPELHSKLPTCAANKGSMSSSKAKSTTKPKALPPEPESRFCVAETRLGAAESPRAVPSTLVVAEATSATLERFAEESSKSWCRFACGPSSNSTTPAAGS